LHQPEYGIPWTLRDGTAPGLAKRLERAPGAGGTTGSVRGEGSTTSACGGGGTTLGETEVWVVWAFRAVESR
jgi:hypothetical protein